MCGRIGADQFTECAQNYPATKTQSILAPFVLYEVQKECGGGLDDSLLRRVQVSPGWSLHLRRHSQNISFDRRTLMPDCIAQANGYVRRRIAKYALNGPGARHQGASIKTDIL